MAKVGIDGLAEAIGNELTLYAEGVKKGLDREADKAIKKLVKQTKASAPTGKRGKFRSSISSKKLEDNINVTGYVWYVKAPEHRLTHLLVHGHATKNGGRTRGNPFLQNAVSEVIPEYEKKVKEVLQNGE